MFEDKFFADKKYNTEKLINYGFVKTNSEFKYSVSLADVNFTLEIFIYPDGRITSVTTDNDSAEEYTLHKVREAAGGFIGKIRNECEQILADISEKCFDKLIFKGKQSIAVIDYINKIYGDLPEYLWEKLPRNAIWRRKDNKKWYAAMLIIPESKLGLSGSQNIEILNVKSRPENIISTVDNIRFFPGWHMNKKNWLTVILNNSLPESEIFRIIDESYTLALK